MASNLPAKLGSLLTLKLSAQCGFRVIFLRVTNLSLVILRSCPKHHSISPLAVRYCVQSR